MVSGTDEHGTPILVEAEKEGVSPARAGRPLQPRDRRRTWSRSGCRTTCSPGRRPATTTRWRRSCSGPCTRNGYMIEQTTRGAISPSTGRTLPDRYIEGTCPICGYDGARGDQCDNCGNQLDPVDLINPRSRINGETPGVHRDRALLPRPAGAGRRARRVAASRARTGGPTCCKFSLNLLDDIRPRAMTRDIDWGIPVPLPGWEDNPTKRLYVWFDAVIGYLSASIEWARRFGDDAEAWRQLVAAGRRRPVLLLHGQGQHHLPLADLAGRAARLQRRGRQGRRAGRVRRSWPCRPRWSPAST